VLIGRPERLAEICGMKGKATYAWRFATGRHDEGDIRSARFMRRLLQHSDRKGLGVKPRWLIEGASRAEVAEVLRLRGWTEEQICERLPEIPSESLAAE